MAASSTEIRDAIRRTLAHHAGSAPDSRDIAAATLTTWGQMAARLAPIVGAGGVDVLLRRTLHLTSTTIPWFAIAAESRDAAAGLEACFADRGAEPAAEAAQTLLVTFYELLGSMVGESLTQRLLRPVWTPGSVTSTPESTR